MPASCIFCDIVDGRAPARTVAETDDAVAFLDANPLAPGHTLVVPREHHVTLDDVPADEATGLYSLLHRVVPAVEDAVDADATTVAFNNGRAAGQEVDHVHGHVVPRFADDGSGPIHGLFRDRPRLDDDEMDDVAGRIAARMG
ncbi:MAG: HIT family protein [Halanaeroarchaeum sp.]